MRALRRLYKKVAPLGQRRAQHGQEKRGLRVLILGKVWPEPNSSAAGVRTAGIITALQQGQHAVAFASNAKRNQHSLVLAEQGVEVRSCAPNQADVFSELLSAVDPEVVIFDRRVFTLRKVDPQNLAFVRITFCSDFHVQMLRNPTKVGSW